MLNISNVTWIIIEEILNCEWLKLSYKKKNVHRKAGGYYLAFHLMYSDLELDHKPALQRNLRKNAYTCGTCPLPH